jgi:hypothetical protein
MVIYYLICIMEALALVQIRKQLGMGTVAKPVAISQRNVKPAARTYSRLATSTRGPSVRSPSKVVARRLVKIASEGAASELLATSVGLGDDDDDSKVLMRDDE